MLVLKKLLHAYLMLQVRHHQLLLEANVCQDQRRRQVLPPLRRHPTQLRRRPHVQRQAGLHRDPGLRSRDLTTGPRLRDHRSSGSQITDYLLILLIQA